MGTGDFGVADFCAALGKAAACQYLLSWGVGTQSTMANRKEPDLGEDDFEALPTRGPK
jgi:hypothetical protein